MEWKDRVPTKANRKKITFEDSSLGEKYATVEYADDPVEVGTPLNKLNMLKGFNSYVCGYLHETMEQSKTITLDFEPYAIIAIGTLDTSWYRAEVLNSCEIWFNGHTVKTGNLASQPSSHIIQLVNGKTVTFHMEAYYHEGVYYGGELIYIALRKPIE